MADTKRAEPLVKTAVAVTRGQWERLRERGKVEERSVSYYVRTAIDRTYPEATEADDEPLAATA